MNRTSLPVHQNRHPTMLFHRHFPQFPYLHRYFRLEHMAFWVRQFSYDHNPYPMDDKGNNIHFIEMRNLMTR